jgi:hypothetical protein
MFTVGSTCIFSKVQVGEDVVQVIDTPHPYGGSSGLVWEREFQWPNAGYIAIHFSRFDLAVGDYLQISSSDGKFAYRYDGKGKVVRNGEAVLTEFWATHIPGDKAIVRLYCNNPEGGWGVQIDKWARGYERKHIPIDAENFKPGNTREMMAYDNEPVAMNEYPDTTVSEKSKALVRLLVNGKYEGAGFLVGSEGHIITSFDCIGSQDDADNTDYEFMSEYDVMNGIVETVSGKLVQTDKQLDYALILLSANITEKYGYLQFRETMPEIGESTFIPPYPGSSKLHRGVVAGISAPDGLLSIEYNDDALNIAPGLPVISCCDDLVVALHRRAGESIKAVPIPQIVSDLGFDLPLNSLVDNAAVQDSCPTAPIISGPKNGNCTNTLRPSFRWNAVVSTPAVTKYRICLYTGNCNGGVEIDCFEVGSVTQYTYPVDLVPGTHYYWKMRAYNTFNGGCWSIDSVCEDFWTPGPPPAPVPIAPIGTSGSPTPTTTTPKLSWNKVTTTCPAEDADMYQVQVVRVDTGELRIDETVTATSYKIPANSLLSNKTYKWRVRAHNSIDWGPWCIYRFFITSL